MAWRTRSLGRRCWQVWWASPSSCAAFFCCWAAPKCAAATPDSRYCANEHSLWTEFFTICPRSCVKTIFGHAGRNPCCFVVIALSHFSVQSVDNRLQTTYCSVFNSLAIPPLMSIFPPALCTKATVVRSPLHLCNRNTSICPDKKES